MLDVLVAYPGLAAAGAGIVGLMVGSFLNVVIARLPARIEHEWRSQSREVLELEPVEEAPPPGLVRPASRCPHCNNPIRAHQNIPVVSYLLLGGKCAQCKARISIQYPLVELLTGLLSAYVIWHFGPTVQGASMLVLTWFLIAMSGVDIKTQLLPDNLTLPLIWFGLLLSLWSVFIPAEAAIVGAIAGYMSLWTVFQLFRLVTGKQGMGYGDFKLLAVFGAFGGWELLPLIIIMSSLVGAVVGSIALKMQGADRQTPIPFGPYLAIAGWIGLIWGQQLIGAYLSFAGLE
ncbi:MAG: type 4 prepilin-like proteins leader peptide-processing enzyme [Lysobacteraceae bacterium]|nr:MAG: type 4 prepilin-like proteins leader peptide-processing enzyme [Xanthomonadaceae bacterium]